MSTLTVYGASDDLVEVELDGKQQEFDSGGRWSATLVAPNGETANLYVDYRDNGTWTATLGQYDEDYKLPEWAQKANLSVDQDVCSYSTILTIELPEGTTLVAS